MICKCQLMDFPSWIFMKRSKLVDFWTKNSCLFTCKSDSSAAFTLVFGQTLMLKKMLASHLQLRWTKSVLSMRGPDRRGSASSFNTICFISYSMTSKVMVTKMPWHKTWTARGRDGSVPNWESLPVPKIRTESTFPLGLLKMGLRLDIKSSHSKISLD